MPRTETDAGDTWRRIRVAAENSVYGALRLISGNLHCDAYALLRILFESYCIMYFGDTSVERMWKVHRTLSAPAADPKSSWTWLRRASARAVTLTEAATA